MGIYNESVIMGRVVIMDGMGWEVEWDMGRNYQGVMGRVVIIGVIVSDMGRYNGVGSVIMVQVVILGGRM